MDSDIIQEAIRSRAARHEHLQGLAASGHSWERRDGTVWIIRSKEYARQESRNNKDRQALLVNDENMNRWAIYETLIKVNNWPKRSLSAVQLIFHEERMAFMMDGQIYETASGERAVIGR